MSLTFLHIGVFVHIFCAKEFVHSYIKIKFLAEPFE